MNDIHFACHQLRNSPGFTTVVLSTLALGIRAHAAICSITQHDTES